MSKVVVQRLQLAAERFQIGDYLGAVAELKEVNPEELSPHERAYFFLLFSEANINLGNYDVEKQLEQAIDYYRSSTDNGRFAITKWLQGWLLESLGDFIEAREAFLEAYVAYKRCGDLKGQAKALNRLSFVSLKVGETDLALKHLHTCISLMKSLDDKANVTRASINLATTYYLVGKLTQSQDLYDEIRNSVQELNEKKHCINFFINAAIPQALKGDIEDAQVTVKKAVPYLEGLARESALYQENLGWICFLAKDYSEAEKALLLGLEISLEIAPESALVSQIKRLLGDVYYSLGRYESSRKYTQEALSIAEKINEKVEIAACYRVFAQLECIKGNKTQAREWFTKAVNIFTAINSQYELAVTRYLAAVSGLYGRGERQALMYLAREYFAGEQVVHYIESIDAEIEPVSKAVINRRQTDDNEEPCIITVNPATKRLVDLARHVAPSEMSIFLTGATGTGKDLLAQYIHYHSGRTGKFVSLNAAAIPDSMIEAELFGYRRGSYTGADHDKIGLIEEADGGTLYLNEVADSSMRFQIKLLDALERKVIRRLGETKERPVAFRLIAATNHDVEKHVKEGSFRIDLYHRLCEFPIHLPLLVDRREDIPALLMHFLTLAGIDYKGNGDGESFQRLVETLSAKDWPGNIRELKAEIKRLMLISDGDISSMIEPTSQPRAAVERNRLRELLQQTNWNRRQVARILGMSEGGIRYRIRKYQINP